MIEIWFRRKDLTKLYGRAFYYDKYSRGNWWTAWAGPWSGSPVNYPNSSAYDWRTVEMEESVTELLE